MDHDPLCVCSRKDHAHWLMDDPEVCMCCSCEDIAKVRADEREQAAQRVEALKPDRVFTAGGIGYCDALRDAAAAARGGGQW